MNAVFLRMLYHVRNCGGETTSFIARRPTLWVCLPYIANHAHCTPVKCWFPLVCPHCLFFQLQRTDWNNGQSILHLTNTRLYNVYHYDTCQWSRVITGTQTQFKINSLSIRGVTMKKSLHEGCVNEHFSKLNLYRSTYIQLIIVLFCPPPLLQKGGAYCFALWNVEVTLPYIVELMTFGPQNLIRSFIRRSLLTSKAKVNKVMNFTIIANYY